MATVWFIVSIHKIGLFQNFQNSLEAAVERCSVKNVFLEIWQN